MSAVKIKALFLIVFVAVLANLVLGFFVFVATVDSAEIKKELKFSRSFLGAYKKTMRFEDEIKKNTDKYKIDPVLVWAIAMYESGGNENLSSRVGAKRLMQVMPDTQKRMGVKGKDIKANIEAGVKFLAYLKKRFNKKDVSPSRLKSLMIMGYNGGEGRVKRGLVKIETYQYLQGVAIYYNLLSQYFDEIKELTKSLEILTLEKGYSWGDISLELNVSILELRLFNPFLAFKYSEKISKNQIVVYPREARGIFYEVVLTEDGKVKRLFYIVKRGDILHHISNAFRFTYDDLRDKTGMLLWGFLQLGDKIEVTDSPFLIKTKKTVGFIDPAVSCYNIFI